MSTLLNLISLNKLNSFTLYHTLCFLYTYFVTKGCPLYIYSIGRTKLYFHFEEIWRKSLFFLCDTLGFLNTHIITKGCPLYIYSIGRTRVYFYFEEIWRNPLFFLCHTLGFLKTQLSLIKDALSIFTLLVEQNFTLRKSEENLFTFFVTLLTSCIHILLEKDALSIFNLWVEQNYSFT